MTCPMCNDTGTIGVNVIDGPSSKLVDQEWRPCPMCNRRPLVPIHAAEKTSKPTDYEFRRKRHIRAGHAKRAKQWYMGS